MISIDHTTLERLLCFKGFSLSSATKSDTQIDSLLVNEDGQHSRTRKTPPPLKNESNQLWQHIDLFQKMDRSLPVVGKAACADKNGSQAVSERNLEEIYRYLEDHLDVHGHWKRAAISIKSFATFYHISYNHAAQLLLGRKQWHHVWKNATFREESIKNSPKIYEAVMLVTDKWERLYTHRLIGLISAKEHDLMPENWVETFHNTKHRVKHGEGIVEQILISLGVCFSTEETQRRSDEFGARGTPDFVIESEFFISYYGLSLPIKWVEVKSNALTASQGTRENAQCIEKLQRYTIEFGGPGMVFWFAERLEQAALTAVPPGVICIRKMTDAEKAQSSVTKKQSNPLRNALQVTASRQLLSMCEPSVIAGDNNWLEDLQFAPAVQEIVSRCDDSLFLSANGLFRCPLSSNVNALAAALSVSDCHSVADSQLIYAKWQRLLIDAGHTLPLPFYLIMGNLQMKAGYYISARASLDALLARLNYTQLLLLEKTSVDTAVTTTAEKVAIEFRALFAIEALCALAGVAFVQARERQRRLETCDDCNTAVEALESQKSATTATATTPIAVAVNVASLTAEAEGYINSAYELMNRFQLPHSRVFEKLAALHLTRGEFAAAQEAAQRALQFNHLNAAAYRICAAANAQL